jgi:hypothetical protein
MDVDYRRFRLFGERFGFAQSARETAVLDELDAVTRYHYERGLDDGIPPKVEFRKWSDTIAYYDAKDDYLNIAIEDSVWDEDERVVRHLYESGFASYARKEDIIVHEFGHRAWNKSATRTVPMDATWDESFGRYEGVVAKMTANEVSAYAASSPAEFVSEVYARSYREGNTTWMSPSARNLYNALGGPPLPSEAKVVRKLGKNDPRPVMFGGTP